MRRMSTSARPLAPWTALLREQRYRRHFLRADGRQTAIVTAVIGVSYAAVTGNDFLLLRGSWMLGVALACRVLLLVAVVVALVLLRRARWPRQQDRAFHVAHAGMAISLGTHLTRIPSGQIQGPILGGIAFLCIVYFAERGPIWPRAVLGCLVVITSATTILLGNAQGVIQPAARVSSVIVLIAMNVVGFFSARSFEEQRRKRFEAERRERHARQALAANLRELAVEKDRAEAMSRARTAFLAAMSHEFRTPMNAVIGLSDLLLALPRGAPLDGENREHVRAIHDSARGLLTLLNDILDFAKIDAQKVTLLPAPFHLHRLLSSVSDMLRPAAEARSLELSLDLAPGVPEHLTGDDARLRQVLVNLVSNAIKFTERGTVRIEVGSRPLDGGDHEITFRVADTGIGIPKDALARLFLPFEQADGGRTRRFGGTGLGLAISKQIVQTMGGDIHVESEPGRGSVFSFTLRLAEAAPPEEKAPPPPSRRAERPPLAILVVDDHPVNRQVARAGLGRLGYPVDLASSGPEAILAVTRKDYDVVFMDLQMPGMSGIEATVQIRERLAGKRVPDVIAMTASVFEEDREACRRAGMRDFASKPIDLAQLDALLSRVADERSAGIPTQSSEGIPETRAAAGVSDAASGPISAKRPTALQMLEGLGDAAFFAELCRVFLADTHMRLGRMGDALGRGDARTIEREAHALRSSSGAVGATDFAALCARLEEAAREGHVEGLAGWVGELAVKLAEVERTFAQKLVE